MYDTPEERVRPIRLTEPATRDFARFSRALLTDPLSTPEVRRAVSQQFELRPCCVYAHDDHLTREDHLACGCYYCLVTANVIRATVIHDTEFVNTSAARKIDLTVEVGPALSVPDEEEI